jgi:peptidoglycan/LPS O-acetylase OafA/YrhL
MDFKQIWTAGAKSTPVQSAIRLLDRRRPQHDALPVDEESDFLLETNGEAEEDAVDGEPRMIAPREPRHKFDFYDMISARAPPVVPLILLHLQSIALSILIFLVPSFLQRSTDSSPKKLRSTAYLDGLRGFAAVTVVVQHMISRHIDGISLGYGQGEQPQYWLIQLPFIRLIHCGGAMVKVFFALSGYVLSHKPVQQMRRRQQQALMNTMASSVFRRTIRLYLPVLMCTFIVMVLAGLGIYRSHYGDTSSMVFQGPFNRPTWSEQLADYFHWMSVVLTPFNWNDGPWHTDYGQHLWAVPVELRSSMILFLVQTGVSNMTARSRLLVVSMLMGYTLWCTRWEIFLYLGGMLTAELNFILPQASLGLGRADSLPSAIALPTASASATATPALSEKQSSPLKKSARYLAFGATWVLFLFGLFLAGMPEWEPFRVPGFETISTLTLHTFGGQVAKFWHAIAALLIVAALSFLPSAQCVFTTRPCQYLGHICFSLYLIHNYIMVLVGFPIWAFMWRHVGAEGWRWHAAFWLANAVIFPLVFWGADLFWRACELPSVKFARWVEQKLSLPPAEES